MESWAGQGNVDGLGTVRADFSYGHVDKSFQPPSSNVLRRPMGLDATDVAVA